MYPSTEEEMQVVKVAFCEIAEILLRDVLNSVLRAVFSYADLLACSEV